jgi:hypothetical protein
MLASKFGATNESSAQRVLVKGSNEFVVAEKNNPPMRRVVCLSDPELHDGASGMT